MLVLESDGTSIRRVYPQRLEGSQTSPRRPRLREATSGKPLWPAPHRPLESRLNASPAETRKSRRLPGTSQRFRSAMAGWKRIRAMVKCIALGNSREPPAETFLGRVHVEAKFAGWRGAGQSGLPDVASRSLGRRGEVWLPSRRCAIANHISVPPLRGRRQAVSHPA